MLKIGFLNFVLLISSIAAHIIVPEALQDHEPLAKAVLYVADKYISMRTNTVIVRQMCKHCKNAQQNFQSRLLDYVLLNCEHSLTRLLFMGEIDDQPWNFNIFIIDSADAFDDQVKEIQLNLYEAEFYFVIVLTHTKYLTHAQLEACMVRIVENALRLSVIDVVIIVETANGKILFYKSRVLGRECGEQINMERFNYFYKGKMKRDFLFPRRMRNFNNCTLRVAAYDVPPLLIFRGDKQREDHLRMNGRLSGIDGHLLRILKEKLNFRMKLIFPQVKGEVFDNGTATGCLGMLQRNEADVVVGSFGVMANQRGFLTTSIIYHQSPIVVVVRSGLQYSALKQLLCPFKEQLWSLLILLFSICISSIKYLRRHAAKRKICTLVFDINTNRQTVFNLIVTFIGLPARHLPQRDYARLLILCWIFLTFVLRNIYQAKMFDSLRVARRIPLPHKVEDLIHHNYHMISRDYHDFYPHNLTWIVNADYPTRFAMLESADDSLRIAANSLLDYLAHHNELHWNSSRLTMVNDPIYLFQLVMFFQKHSRLKFAFDIKLKQLMSSGFISYFSRFYVKRKFLSMNEQNLEVSQISNEMLYGIYGIYAVLIACAIFVFALELLARKCRLLRSLFDYLRYYD